MRPASDAAMRNVDKEAMFTARRDVSPLLGVEKGTSLARAQEVGCVPHPTLARQNLTSQLFLPGVDYCHDFAIMFATRRML